MNGYVTTEVNAFTENGFVTEQLSAEMEVMNQVVATLVARLRNSNVTINSVFPPYSIAMATMTVVMKVTRGIVKPLQCAKLANFVVVAAQFALVIAKSATDILIALMERMKITATSMNARITMVIACIFATTQRLGSTVRVNLDMN